MLVQPSQEETHLQMQRVLHSATFRNSYTLQQLLQFLVAQAYGPDAETLKEYTIGVEALSKAQDFDPKTDPIVRVQTHRLRQRLREYYDSEGRHDPIVIAIPKGHYLPAFEAAGNPLGTASWLSSPASAMAASAEPEAAHDLQESRAEGPMGGARLGSPGLRPGNGLFRRAAIACLAAAALFAAGFWLGKSPHRFSAGVNGASASSDPASTGRAIQ